MSVAQVRSSVNSLLSGIHPNTERSTVTVWGFFRFKLKVAVAVTDTEEDALLNATQIGELVNLSARRVNLLLIEKELQYKSDEKNIPYRPTEKGKEFSRMVPSVAKHKDQGVFQLRWRPEVAELLKANQ